jgi:hypothetical protein
VAGDALGGEEAEIVVDPGVALPGILVPPGGVERDVHGDAPGVKAELCVRAAGGRAIEERVVRGEARQLVSGVLKQLPALVRHRKPALVVRCRPLSEQLVEVRQVVGGIRERRRLPVDGEDHLVLDRVDHVRNARELG